MTESNIPGVLMVVATPIGNLGDITYRARQVLADCDYIAAEDSRHTRKLLNHLDIKQTIVSLHEHNERQKSESVISDCLKGAKVALVSDAGTPLISDPGYFLIQTAIKAGVKVEPLPGPCAAIAALSVSGLASDRFTFEGFLPAKLPAREKKLQLLVKEPRTMIFYESTHRIVDCIQSMADIFGETRELTLAKELTKTFESVIKGSVREIHQWLVELVERQKGEFVIVVSGAAEETSSKQKSIDDTQLMQTLLSEVSLKQAAKIAAKITSGKKNYFYQIGLELHKD